MKTFYYEPTMVKFLDVNSEDLNYIGGIAYMDEIICGCCGGIISIEGLYEDCTDLKTAEANPASEYDNPIIELSWVDISNEIMCE